MPSLPDPAHEAFAHARATGKSLMDAFTLAGRTGRKTSAFRLSQRPEIKARIAELQSAAATAPTYQKTQAVRDLLDIIHAPASAASKDHPLSETRMGKNGPYYRFPSKLAAMARLIKLLDWDQPVTVDIELKDNFVQRLSDLRTGRIPQPSAAFARSPSRPAPQETASPDSSIDPPPFPAASPASPIPCSSAPGEPSAARQPVAGIENLAPGAHPLPPRHEAFAQARFQGLGVMAAYRVAGYTGKTPNLASRLHASPDISARIAHLNHEVAAAAGYDRSDAARDLMHIVHAPPADAHPDHPLCEMRMTSWGSYHRFPSKLAAITLLLKMLGWEAPLQLQLHHDPDAGFKALAAFVRQRS